MEAVVYATCADVPCLCSVSTKQQNYQLPSLFSFFFFCTFPCTKFSLSISCTFCVFFFFTLAVSASEAAEKKKKEKKESQSLLHRQIHTYAPALDSCKSQHKDHIFPLFRFLRVVLFFFFRCLLPPVLRRTPLEVTMPLPPPRRIYRMIWRRSASRTWMPFSLTLPTTATATALLPGPRCMSATAPTATAANSTFLSVKTAHARQP